MFKDAGSIPAASTMVRRASSVIEGLTWFDIAHQASKHAELVEAHHGPEQANEANTPKGKFNNI